jgi:hypothetical protein
MCGPSASVGTHHTQANHAMTFDTSITAGSNVLSLHDRYARKRSRAEGCGG